MNSPFNKRAPIHKCRACGNRLRGGICDNRYCPNNEYIQEKLAAALADQACPYCRFEPCICEQKEANFEPPDPEGWEGGFARNH